MISSLWTWLYLGQSQFGLNPVWEIQREQKASEKNIPTAFPSVFVSVTMVSGQMQKTLRKDFSLNKEVETKGQGWQ